MILEEDMPVPPNCRLIDKVSVRDMGFKLNCGREKVLLEAKVKVVNKGGNILKITRWKKPSALGSTCYQVWGEAYFADDVAAVKQAIDSIPDTVTHNLINENADYAILYIYRPRAYVGSLLRYVVHLDDEDILTVANGTFDTVRIYKEGPASIWATIETRSEQTLDIRFGKAYFIRCEVGTGVWAGRPNIFFVSPNRGYKEYKQGSSRPGKHFD